MQLSILCRPLSGSTCQGRDAFLVQPSVESGNVRAISPRRGIPTSYQDCGGVKSRRRMLRRMGGMSPPKTINMAVQLTTLEIVEWDFQPNEGRPAPDCCASRVGKSKALFRQAINSHRAGLLHNGTIWPAPIGYRSPCLHIYHGFDRSVSG
jgi:hypothetical protein